LSATKARCRISERSFGVERSLGVVGGGVGDLDQGLAGGGVLDRERVAPAGVAPCAADEQLLGRALHDRVLRAGDAHLDLRFGVYLEPSFAVGQRPGNRDSCRLALLVMQGNNA